MTTLLAKGLGDPVFESQQTFRAVLDALARPGVTQTTGTGLAPPSGLAPAAYALALALIDGDTPVWLSLALRTEPVMQSLKFHCGCPLVDRPEQATFALVAAPDKPELTGFAPGDDRYPDRSTTVIWQLPALTGGAPVRLQGPGVNGAIDIAPSGLPADFWLQWADNHALYPLGTDLVLVSAVHLLGLPRSTTATPVAEG